MLSRSWEPRAAPGAEHTQQYWAPIHGCSDHTHRHYEGDITAYFIVLILLSTEDGILLVSEPFSHMCLW